MKEENDWLDSFIVNRLLPITFGVLLLSLMIVMLGNAVKFWINLF